ncbi:MAG: ABC transporter substrate-binding protein [Acetobacteraceae bacterium]
MKRRTLLQGAAATLAAPRILRAEAARVVRFVPFVDLGILDPVINTAALTRTHGYLVFDTLYGTASDYSIEPQMVEGHVTDSDFRTWTLTLREGLAFHSGEKVLARDVVASIRRWGAVDQSGRTLLAATDELAVVSDRVLRFRMKQPFPLLPDALGKIAPSMPCIMPERIASADPAKPVKEIVGSGPFRFVANERVPGARVVYEKFADYVPRPNGVPGLTSGPKVVNIDRVEWITMPEFATAAAALQRGEVDWVDVPSPDLLPMLRRDPKLVVDVKDKTGVVPVLRFNCIQPPFDNVAIRRAVLGAASQADFLSALSSDSTNWRDHVGVFTPGTPMASAAGIQDEPTDLATARQAIQAAGYKGERVVVMTPTDHPVNGPAAQVAADLMKKLGLNVDAQAMDAGTMFERRASREPVDKGGWSCFPSAVAGRTR